MTGKHGESQDTMVPLPKMVTEMKKESEFTSTEEMKDDVLFSLIVIPLT